MPEFPFRQERVTARKEHCGFVETRHLKGLGDSCRPQVIEACRYHCAPPETLRGGGLANCGTKLLGMQRHIQMRHAERGQRVQNGVDDGRRGPDGSCLADSLDPERGER